jgi:hypothetical protein
MCPFVPVWILLSHTLLQSPHHPQSFSRGWPLWGLQIGGNVWQRDMGCMAGGDEQPLWNFCDYCLRFQNFMLSCAVLLMVYFSNTCVRSKSRNTQLQGFSGPNVQIWGNCLTTWHNVYRSHTFCIPPPQPTKRDLVRMQVTELRLAFLRTCNSWSMCSSYRVG